MVQPLARASLTWTSAWFLSGRSKSSKLVSRIARSIQTRKYSFRRHLSSFFMTRNLALADVTMMLTCAFMRCGYTSSTNCSSTFCCCLSLWSFFCFCTVVTFYCFSLCFSWLSICSWMRSFCCYMAYLGSRQILFSGVRFWGLWGISLESLIGLSIDFKFSSFDYSVKSRI